VTVSSIRGYISGGTGTREQQKYIIVNAKWYNKNCRTEHSRDIQGGARDDSPRVRDQSRDGNKVLGEPVYRTMDKVIFVPGLSLLDPTSYTTITQTCFIRSMTLKIGFIKRFVSYSVELQFLAHLTVIIIQI